MTLRHASLTVCFTLLATASSFAQAPAAAPPKEPPPPLWDFQLGAAFVGTSGNSDTLTIGGDAAWHYRGEVWQFESTANAVHTTEGGLERAERLIGGARAARALNPTIKLTTGERAEHDPFAGVEYRNLLDGGLLWALVRRPVWTLDGTTSLAWDHTHPSLGPDTDHAVGVLQLFSKVPFGASGDTTQRFTYFPDFTVGAAYRVETEITAQAALNGYLALKLGYLLRYSNQPIAGFKNTDNTTTASVVVKMKADRPAPGG